MTVTVGEVLVRGVLRWCVDRRLPTGRKRTLHPTRREADREAAIARGDIVEPWAAMSVAERRQLAWLDREAREAGSDLTQVFREWQAGRRAEVTRSKSLSTVVAEVIAAKRVANRRANYVSGLKSYLEAFAAGREAAPVSSITARDVIAWLNRNANPATRASNLGRLSALFAYAHRMGYARENVCDRVERPATEHRSPKILSVDDCRNLLQLTMDHHLQLLPWLVLGLFAGIRPQELDRLEWAIVDLKSEMVTVDAAASKVRRRRIVPIPAPGVAWLKECGKSATLQMPRVTRRRAIRELRGRMGWSEWPHDILRHTAASYLLAHHQDAGKVALWLGNSVGILLRHYQQLVTREQAEAWMGLKP